MLLIYFIFGSIFASFAYVVALRLPVDEDFIHSRSHCEHCQHVLKWYDLIPIISFLLLKGRCRYCGNKIAITHLLMEVFGGFCMMICFIDNGNSLISLGRYALIITMMVIALIDQDYMLIPDSLIIIIGLICIYLVFIESITLISHIDGLLFPLLLLLMNAIFKDGFGEGDLLLLCPLCLYLGLRKSFCFLLVSSLLGCVIGLYEMKRDSLKLYQPLPFVPLLLIGLIITIFVI